ncbi:MAG: hypothetical protein LBC33_03515 [Mycoplasmataceae bacterium]|jgi:hypothetical protein|nr:hypothetical protein [Mycoplasmataceae bacterium]
MGKKLFLALIICGIGVGFGVYYFFNWFNQVKLKQIQGPTVINQIASEEKSVSYYVKNLAESVWETKKISPADSFKYASAFDEQFKTFVITFSADNVVGNYFFYVICYYDHADPKKIEEKVQLIVDPKPTTTAQHIPKFFS